MQKKLYNIKMRSAQGGNHKKGGQHISGAERIVPEEDIFSTVSSLLKRSLTHSKGKADFINISLEEIKREEIIYLSSLPITTLEVRNYKEGRAGAIQCLHTAGLSLPQARAILNLLAEAPSLRGAMLIDIHTLKRLEPDLQRGVRATGMDWAPEIYPRLEAFLEKEGLNNIHVREALALASKVARAPGIVAEICWSDDPEYTAGYVASPSLGYMRLTHLKPAGVAKGGRIFCFDPCQANLQQCLHWLEEQITVINEIGPCKGIFSLNNYFGENKYGVNR
ncbi:MAG: 6-carboxyhexanoate--CoA ligase [Peptococcaceae bacterium]|jgi:6-carboxyhexanoate--CoA ligase|nr:6-carboxyhexanoate--CoA ligase [Peptococcaceae bacterium]